MTDSKLIFRIQQPQRECTKKYSSYRSYKSYLAKDFNYRCGYCDDFDSWSGGSSVYHIDHFAPKSKFEHLENEYSNLVYACPFCNRFKSDDWPSENCEISVLMDKGYIDPCDESYIQHFYRDKYGNIRYDSKVGEYMYRKLQLYLPRHRIIWKITHLKKQINEIRIALKKHENDKEKCERLNEIFNKLNHEFHDYFDYFVGEKI